MHLPLHLLLPQTKPSMGLGDMTVTVPEAITCCCMMYCVSSPFYRSDVSISYLSGHKQSISYEKQATEYRNN